MKGTPAMTAPKPQINHGYWRFVVVALLLFLFGSIAANMVATRTSNGGAIQRAFADGGLETITPVDLAPWWLLGRAQLDCQQFMPLAANRFDVPASIARPKFVLTDRKANACTMLASVAERKRLSTNMKELLRKDGFFTAGSTVLPALALIGINPTRWINVAALVAAAIGGLWFVCTGFGQGGRRDRVGATLCMMIASAFLLAVPGSLTAMPTMALLIGSLGGVLDMLQKNTAGPERIAKLSPLLAGALVSLDPMGASAPVGLGVILFLSRMLAPADDNRTVVLRNGGLYVLTVILCWLAYAVAVGMAVGWSDMPAILAGLFLDVREVGYFADLGAAATGTYQWLSGEAMMGPLGAFDFLFSIACGLLLYAAVDPLDQRPQRREPIITALIALAPILLWALLYPGHWRRAEEQYVLPLMWFTAVALAAPFSLLIEAARRVARSRSTLTLPAPVSPLA